VGLVEIPAVPPTAVVVRFGWDWLLICATADAVPKNVTIATAVRQTANRYMMLLHTGRNRVKYSTLPVKGGDLPKNHDLKA